MTISRSKSFGFLFSKFSQQMFLCENFFLLRQMKVTITYNNCLCLGMQLTNQIIVYLVSKSNSVDVSIEFLTMSQTKMLESKTGMTVYCKAQIRNCSRIMSIRVFRFCYGWIDDKPNVISTEAFHFRVSPRTIFAPVGNECAMKRCDTNFIEPRAG